MTTPWDFPRTPRALHDWIHATLGLRIARMPLLGGHHAPFDYLLHTHFEGASIDPENRDREPDMPGPGTPPPAPSSGAPPDPHRNGTVGARLTPLSLASRSELPHPPDLVLWANRGGGKTFLGALATTLDLIFKPGIEVRILAGSLEQAARMLAHLHRFFEAPALAALVDGRATQRRLTLTNQSTVEILAASQASVRGTRVQKLRCDEVDLFDFELWEAAQLTTRSGMFGGIHVRGAIECLSTMHRPHGLMFNLVKDTTAGVRRLLKWGVLDSLELCPPERPCGPCPLLPECKGMAKRPTNTAISGNPDRPPRPVAALGDGERQGEGRNAPTAGEGSPQPARHARDLADLSGFPASCLFPIPLPVVRSGDGARGADGDDPDAGHIPIDDAITLKSRVSQSAWESEMLCLRPSRTHAVFPEFDPNLHVVDDVPREQVTWVAGMDFGFRAQTVILWGAIDPQGGLWIADEHVRTETLMREHIAALRRAPDERAIPLPAWLGVDPAGDQSNDQTGLSNIDVLNQSGLVVRSRRCSLGESLNLVRARLRPALGPPRLHIHRRCAALIEALERYHYPDDDPESMIPVKDGPDHAADALRYLILNLDKKTTATVSSYAGGR